MKGGILYIFNRNMKIFPDELAYYGNRSSWFWMDVYSKSLAIFGGIINSFTGKLETANS